MVEYFAMFDTILSDSFPKEINKAKIKEIFEILHTQEWLDLIQEMKNLLQLKTNRKDSLKITNEKNNFPSVNQVLPTEVLKKILKNLDFRSLCYALQTCKRLKEIINGFEFVKLSQSKFFLFYQKFDIVHNIKIFDLNCFWF